MALHLSRAAVRTLSQSEAIAELVAITTRSEISNRTRSHSRAGAPDWSWRCLGASITRTFHHTRLLSTGVLSIGMLSLDLPSTQ
jgi:hypothetical protein